MKRLLVILIALSLAVSTFPDTALAANKQYSSPELRRAVTLGIGAYSMNTAVTYKQFFKMLDVAVNLSNSQKLAAWKKMFPSARVSDKKMTRQEGMLAVYYAAEALGKEFCMFNSSVDWTVTHNKIGDSCWDDMTWNYPLFPDWKKAATLINSYDHMVNAYFYSFGRESMYSGKTIFDFDSVSVSMRPKDKFTYEEALLAALRLHDSNAKLEKRVPTREDKAFLKRADARREAILNSKTNVTITGTSYYVSNTGNDSNDGLSPTTSWATLQKVNMAALKPGDGVFFERGGLWRSGPWLNNPQQCGDGVLYAQNGVTYSAYGEGEKPKILGSPENGAGAEKWILLNGTKNIWVFYKDMQDCGAIVFNNEDSMALKTCAYWDGSHYYKSSDGQIVDEPRVRYDVKTLENLRFFNEIYYPGKEVAGYYSTRGKLYLRCDKGNPGSVYSSIEFLTGNNDWNQGFASGQDGCVFDNLCFLYGAQGTSLIKNSTMQNCEIGWIGGQILGYSFNNLGTDADNVIVRYGDGIMCYGMNDTVKNNYVHHTFDYGISIEGFAASSTVSLWKRKNITITGNIVENSFGGLSICDWYAWGKKVNLPSFNNICIDGNYILQSGYGWSHQGTGEYTGSLTLNFHPGSINNIKITNNVLYISKYNLVTLGSGSSKYRPSFSGNTYVQDEFGGMIDRTIENLSSSHNQTYLYSSFSPADVAADVLGDKSAHFFD